MNIVKCRDVKTPIRSTDKSGGIDFFIPNDMEWEYMTLQPGTAVNIPSGIKCNVPPGFALIAFNKSGVALNKQLDALACVVDEDYVNEIHLNVINVGNDNQIIKRGEKLLQFLLIPIKYENVVVCETDDQCFGFKIKETTRTGGFGSTGLT
jgi:dUTP pyrophosphatase